MLVQRITVTVNSRWRSKQTPIEVIVTRVTIRTVSYVAVHGAICGTLPRWQFVAEFQPVQERKKKGR